MQTVQQQIDNRRPIIDGLVRNVFASHSVQAGCAYLSHVVTPTVAGGLFALPDYASKRPDQSAAIEYAVKLIANYEDDARAYCLTCDISKESPEAWDVTVAFGPWTAVVTVWTERREDGTAYIYGEY